MRRRTKSVTRGILLAVAMLGIALAISMWRPAAQKPGSAAGQQPASGTAIPAEPLDLSHKPGFVAVGDRGPTYHALEGRAVRTTTIFRDATVVAERTPDGRLRSRVLDGTGNTTATFTVDDGLTFDRSGETPKRVARHRTLRPTLDWSNRQAYLLSRDRLDSPLEWQNTFLRSSGSRGAIDEPTEVRTESTGGFDAHARRQKAAAPLVGDVLVSRILKNGAEIGRSTYYVHAQVFVWSFPGLTEAMVTPKELATIGGRWAFEPDLEWMNTQNLAFHEFFTLMKERGRVAQRPPVMQRIVDFFAPAVQANEPGCDGLFWLNNTIYRPCCDIHDACYYKVGCISWSWWWGSAWPWGWQCLACNGFAIGCFGVVGARPPFVMSPY